MAGSTLPPHSSPDPTAPSPRPSSVDRPGSGNGDGAQSRRTVDRSCVLCNRRKVRCDRRSPCSACLRGGRQCVFPDASDQSRRRGRPRKTTIADVASRVSDLERSIVSSSSPRLDRTVPTRSSNGSQRYAMRRHENSPAAGEILVQNGTSSQYVNEIVMSEMIEADGDQSSLLNTPQALAGDQARDSPQSLMGILSHPASYVGRNVDCGVSKLNGMKLWQTFVENIDAFVKVLHVPTAEIAIFTAINQPHMVKKDTIALLHAVYYAAVTSLDPDEVLRMLGMDRGTALTKFKVEFQKAVAEADILENPTVTLLQGLAIYLHIATVWNHSRGLWILNGLALRIAQSIGLHTDGSKLGLSAFESELRRRVWWHLYFRDSRALEDHGISPALQLVESCTRLPLNLADTDIQPDMAELPPSKMSWTRMTFPLVNMVSAYALQQCLPTTLAAHAPGQRMARRDEVFRELKEKLDMYCGFCNPVVPLQKVTLQVGLAVYHKLDLVTRQQVANMESPDDRDSFATNENLDAACTSLELQLSVWQDELLRPHRWSQRVHPQYHLLLYALWHLCLRPTGPHMERAWGLIEEMFRVEHQRLTDAGSGPSLKFLVLLRLRRRAEAVREASGNASVGDDGPVNEVPNLDKASELIFDPGRLEHAEGFGETLSGEWMSAMDGLPLPALPDWNTLVGDLQMDGPNFSAIL